MCLHGADAWDFLRGNGGGQAPSGVRDQTPPTTEVPAPLHSLENYLSFLREYTKLATSQMRQAVLPDA